mmetsp:Transcript_27198/g.49157  ORF Transcript_27198/g.49157 Transcript_27198/m.49157 type:complete len:94 (-) Transcript_27198:72-353(-)
MKMGGMENKWHGNQLLVAKKSKNVVKQRKQTARSNASSKPLITKTTSKSKKGGTGATKAASIKTMTTTKKRDSRKSSGKQSYSLKPAGCIQAL